MKTIDIWAVLIMNSAGDWVIAGTSDFNIEGEGVRAFAEEWNLFEHDRLSCYGYLSQKIVRMQADVPDDPLSFEAWEAAEQLGRQKEGGDTMSSESKVYEHLRGQDEEHLRLLIDAATQLYIDIKKGKA